MSRRQLNVSQQVAASREDIESVCDYAVSEASPVPWLSEVLLAQGQAPQHGIVVKCRSVPEQEGEFFELLWLTSEGRFWSLEVVVPRGGGDPHLERFEEVTQSVPVSASVKGIGSSLGAIAMSVLIERVKLTTH